MYKLHFGDNLDILKTIPDASIDSVITDPPYAGIKRDYGFWEEKDWHDMMEKLIKELRRVLKPTGSAMFVLQASQSTIGTMRPWLWEFLAKYTKEWNMVQDAYWWNYSYMPTTHVSRKHRLMRPSLKLCAWFGAPDCYRDQDQILWKPSEANKAHDLQDRALKKYPSGSSMREGRCIETMNARGGSTPFNVVPLANDKESEVTDVLESALLELEENQDFVLQTPHDKVAKYLAKEVKNKANRDNVIMCTGGKKAGSAHGATTPFQLCEYWVNYITPKGGTVLDPFSGTGTVGRAAIKHGFNYIGIERYEDYHIEAEKGLAEVSKKMESIL